MKINSYSFGKIVINNKSYHKDILIFNEKVKPNWWRDKGHNLQIEDLDWVLKQNPDYLIIGTGKFGVMKVSEEVKAKIKNKGIKLFTAKTKKAVAKFNEMIEKESDLAAGFHLTC